MINQSAIWDEYCTYRGKFFHGPDCPNGHDGKHVTLAGAYYGSVSWEQYSPLDSNVRFLRQK